MGETKNLERKALSSHVIAGVILSVAGVTLDYFYPSYGPKLLTGLGLGVSIGASSLSATFDYFKSIKPQ